MQETEESRDCVWIDCKPFALIRGKFIVYSLKRGEIHLDTCIVTVSVDIIHEFKIQG